MKHKIQRLRNITKEEGIIGGLRAIQRYFGSHVLRHNPILRWKFERQYGRGLDVMQQDWDNLIILDACRYDTFEEHTRFEGKVQKVVSAGNYSWEFMTANFVGQELHDTIYITANPYSARINESVFFKLISLIDDWDENTGTVLPEDVTQKAIQVAEDHPDKRLIIHYMQPHAPHIGSIQNEFAQTGFNKYHGMGVQPMTKEGISIFEAVRRGLITSERLHESYVENLRIVEGAVESLTSKLIGKTVISADHGENLGERVLGLKIYGHGNDTPECRFVPWLELDYESRRKVMSSEPMSDVRPGDSTIDQRLRDLGYL
jgi:hypothetical protein